MTWRKKQGAATFRGVPFFVDTGEESGGRRTVAHEFPFSEKAPFSEDLGAKGHEFTVDGYVLGADYETKKRALQDALDSDRGPGELVHPYFGTKRVAVSTYRVRQSKADGGMARFSIDFIETSAKPNTPTVNTDARAALVARVSASQASAVARLRAGHTPAPLVGAPAAEVGALETVLGLANKILRALPVLPDARAEFARAVEAVNEIPTPGLKLLVDIEIAFFDAVFGGLAVAFVGLPDPSTQFLKFFELDLGARPSGSTPERLALAADFDLVRHHVQRCAINYAAAAIVDQVFVAYDDAVISREAITARIDQHVEAVVDDTFAAITDLRSSLVEAVPGAAADLPRIQQYTPPAVVPSLVLAHRLYGDLEREEDVIRRNGIRHPACVPPNPLEVLSDG